MAVPTGPAYTWTAMGDVESGSIAQPPTSPRPAPPLTASSEPKGPPPPAPLPARAASDPRSQQNRLTSTFPLIPGTLPVLVYCQNVQVPQPRGTRGLNVVLSGSAG